ncbi:hypothetical protein MPSEU_000681700 [Mayamaea pseudoterrestris]|nr:hypothetical protein MPSEU_000681700 [Mayamaea pseudoterrestris]
MGRDGVIKVSEGDVNESETRQPNAPIFQTHVREFLTPYLPPPVVQAIHRIDPKLEPFTGPEACITIAFSLLASWMVLLIIRFIASKRFTRTGSAIAGHDNTKSSLLLHQADELKFDATVLLVGPPDAGKTRLYYQLMMQGSDDTLLKMHSNVPTLTSLEPNVGVVHRIRYIDWPGISSVAVNDENTAFSSIWKSVPRLILVIDSTHSGMGPAADVLYTLLQELYMAKQSSKRIKHQLPVIFVACHKQDVPKAKNPKRIQLQLRTELERLLQVNKAAAATIAQDGDAATKEIVQWWPVGEPLELDQLDFCRLHFASTSCAKEVSEELQTFCKRGELSSN